jgi:hypothetical protein
MNDFAKNYTDSHTGISYKLIGDYYFPNLIVSDANPGTIGCFGRERLEYLKNNRRVLYINMLTSGKLNEHLIETDETANDRMELISKQIAEREGVTEKLKFDDVMLWVQKMNGIRNRATEMIRDELIFA